MLLSDGGVWRVKPGLCISASTSVDRWGMVWTWHRGLSKTGFVDPVKAERRGAEDGRSK